MVKDSNNHSGIKIRRHRNTTKKEEDVQLQQHLGRNPQTIRRAGQIDLDPPRRRQEEDDNFNSSDSTWKIHRHLRKSTTSCSERGPEQ